MLSFSHAIARTPAPTFADGLTTATLGKPDVEKARAQHRAYCAALARNGLDVTILDPLPAYPDSTFVEDVAVLALGRAIVTRPGAPQRRGEADAMQATLSERFSDLGSIAAPGTLDGGDVCESEDRFYVGLSRRTNEAGAEQFARWAAHIGYATETIDIRPISSILHLKSGLTYVGDGVFVAMDQLAGHPALTGRDVLRVPAEESYAACCLRVNARVFVPAGFPKTADALRARRFDLEILEMSEFQKMDGALTCLSLRY